jgi:ribosomal protein S27AE
MKVTKTLPAFPNRSFSAPNSLFKMERESEVQVIRCPNCGSYAERRYILSSNLTRTECNKCDYLMVADTTSGRVVEAYAPGIYPHRLR